MELPWKLLKTMLQFKYNIKDCQEFTNYCIPNMVVFGKNFPPNDIPWAEVRTKQKTYYLKEGDYVSKTETGYIINESKN